MIPQRNLSLLSNRLARKGGRRIPEAVLERDYCLSWFLVGLSRSLLRDTLAFKGGTAIKKCFIPDYRFSEDLDFTLRKHVPLERIQEQFAEAFTYSLQASGVRLTISRIDRHSHENSHSFFMGYEGPLPGVNWQGGQGGYHDSRAACLPHGREAGPENLRRIYGLA